MPVSIITTDQGLLYWYKQSCLLLHKDRFFAVDRDNYLGELMLTNISTMKIKVILTYPKVPFCQLHYLLKIQYRAIEGPPVPTQNNVHIAGQSTMTLHSTLCAISQGTLATSPTLLGAQGTSSRPA